MPARRVVGLFAVIQLFLEVQFWLPLWLIYLLDLGIPMSVAFVADGVFRLVVVACEVPLGLLADRLGRRPTYLACALMSVLTFVLVATVSSTASLFVAWAVWGVTWALSSGAAAAYLYELTDALGGDPVRAFGVVRAAGQLAILLSLLASGPLYAVNPRLPFALTALLAAGAALLILRLPEVSRAPRLALRAGVAELRQPQLLLASGIAALLLAFGWSIQILYQPVALRLGLDESQTGWMYAVLAVAGVLGALTVSRVRRPDRTVLGGAILVLAGVAGAAAVLWLAPLVWLPLVAYGFALSWTSAESMVSARATPAVRATALSVVSMAAGLVIAVARPGLGLTSERAGPATALALWAGVGCVVVGVLVVLRRWLVGAEQAQPTRLTG